MITAADLDTTEGVEKFLAAFRDAGACLPAMTFFTRRKKNQAHLRSTLREMVNATADDAMNWPAWIYEHVPVDDHIAQILLNMMEEIEGGTFKEFVLAHVKRAT